MRIFTQYLLNNKSVIYILKNLKNIVSYGSIIVNYFNLLYNNISTCGSNNYEYFYITFIKESVNKKSLNRFIQTKHR